MVDTVNTAVMNNGDKNYVAQFINTSDGTGESAVVKVDISGLTFSDGTVPSSLTLEEVQWNIQGFTSVTLAWDATTDDEMVVLNGNGYKNFEDIGGLSDPQSTGYTGDVVLTTAGAAAGATYDIVCRFTKKA